VVYRPQNGLPEKGELIHYGQRFCYIRLMGDDDKTPVHHVQRHDLWWADK
jgi:hypothetical protein